jgi:hypothetical protein
MIIGLLTGMAAAAASPLSLVEVDVADAGDFEAFRADLDSRCILVGGYAYTAVAEEDLPTFDAAGRTWSVVVAASAEERFLVLPGAAAYDGRYVRTRDLAGGNVVYILDAGDAATLIPLYAFNVLGPAPAEYERPERVGALYDPEEAAATERVSQARLISDVTTLQDFYSRYVLYHGNAAATAFLEEEYREIIRTEVERQYFPLEIPAGSAEIANVVAVIPGVLNPDQQIVVGAHFDSFTFAGGDSVAPGADDNASGTAAVLECARILSGYAFDRTLVFVAFNAEEVGLYGSTYYADAALARGDDIRGMINLDMVAYEAGPTYDGTVISDGASLDMAELMASKAERYTTVEMGATSSSTEWSDHAPFWENGYRAIWEYEGWSDASPFIHTYEDNVESLNSDFFVEMTRVLVATAYDLAGPNKSPLMGIVRPDGSDYADEAYTVSWWDVDQDDVGRDAEISLYWAEDNTGEDGTLIAAGIAQNDEGNRGSYEWDTSALAAGRYYVYGVIDDGVNDSYTAPSVGPLRVTHDSRVVAYPNPVRPRDGGSEVTFAGVLPGDTIVIYDLAGTKVAELTPKGPSTTWDAGGLAGGVYIYRVESSVMAETASGKIAVLK